MITSPIDSNPLLNHPQLPGATWRSLSFSHTPVMPLTWGDGADQLTIALPDDLHRAVPKRRAEFLAGRLCAALALQENTLPTHVPRLGRAPLWPKGCVGSITHTNTFAAAIISTDCTAIGLDCETLMPDQQAHEICNMILTSAEANLRPTFLPFAAFVTLVFSAKEALYKAISNRIGRVLEFKEVLLTGLTAYCLHLSFGGHDHVVYWKINDQTCCAIYAEPHLTKNRKPL